ncbi:MAG TPA: hypothetical protein PK760_01890 [Flavobacteriales bacterium]|nr:hypothetical protein [Flavobacteriales bacterium]
MPDVLQLLQNRVGPLKGKQREVADHFLWTALLQIDMIDHVKELQQKNRTTPSADAEKHAAPFIKEEMTREEVYLALNCKRTHVWELEKLDLLHPYKVSGRGMRFHGFEVERVKAMDPEEVGLMIKQRNPKKSVSSKKREKESKRERATSS